VVAVICTHINRDFDVISKPEFFRKGLALDDYLKPDQVVIGAKSNIIFMSWVSCLDQIL
jgi:UDP-glucose 6-dehydrogenase